MPFAWKGVRLKELGARALRVRRLVEGESLGITASDENGIPVLSVDSLVARPVDRARLRAATGKRSLYRRAWRPLPSPAGEPAGDPAVEDLRAAGKGDPATLAKALAAAVLERMREHLAQGEEDSRLAILTENALATAGAEAPNLAAASLAGLVRSAAAEHPGRFCLIDTDGTRGLRGRARAGPRRRSPRGASSPCARASPRCPAWCRPRRGMGRQPSSTPSAPS